LGKWRMNCMEQSGSNYFLHGMDCTLQRFYSSLVLIRSKKLNRARQGIPYRGLCDLQILVIACSVRVP
jgi:hypothetical protein